MTAAQGALAPDQSGFVVTFALEEGPFYRLGGVAVVSEVEGLDSAQLLRPAGVRSGAIYKATLLEQGRVHVRDRVEALGFGAAEVSLVLDSRPQEGLIDVTYRVTPGPPLQIERIEIEGNLRTRDYVIRREMRLAEGDAFSRARLQRSLQRIRGLGYFADVRLKTRQGSSDQQVIVSLEVQEKSTGSLNFGGGVSSNGVGSFNISYVEKNFLGRGQQVTVSGDFGAGGRDYTLAYNEPWLFGREISGGVNVFNTSQQVGDAYTLSRQGASVTASYKLSERWRQSFTLTSQVSNVTDVTSTSPVILDQVGGVDKNSLASQFSYFDLDSPVTPTTGVLLDTSMEVAGGIFGGTVDWLSSRVTAKYFTPISEQLVLKLSGSVGHISSSSSQRIPLADRFIQGQNLVRGFASDGIGPRTELTGDAVGATRFYGASSELYYDIPGLRDLGITGRLFIEAGTAYDVGQAHSLDFGSGETLINDSTLLRSSYGYGVTWNSPLGLPLRFDWATPKDYEAFDQLQTFSFNLGLSL